MRMKIKWRFNEIWWNFDSCPFVWTEFFIIHTPVSLLKVGFTLEIQPVASRNEKKSRLHWKIWNEESLEGWAWLRVSSICSIGRYWRDASEIPFTTPVGCIFKKSVNNGISTTNLNGFSRPDFSHQQVPPLQPKSLVNPSWGDGKRWDWTNLPPKKTIGVIGCFIGIHLYT